MNKLTTLTAISILSLGFAGSALALNPQPEPPGVAGQHVILTTQSTAGGAAASDEYCGTKVPGHPHAVLCRKAGGDPGSHVTLNPQPARTTIGSATAGAGSGK